MVGASLQIKSPDFQTLRTLLDGCRVRPADGPRQRTAAAAPYARRRRKSVMPSEVIASRITPMP